MYRYNEIKVYIDEELKESKGIVFILTHFTILEIFEDSPLGVSFKASTLPDVAGVKRAIQVGFALYFIIYKN